MLFSLSVPADNLRGPLFMEKALAAIHQQAGRHRSCTFTFANYAGEVGLYCRCSDDWTEAVMGAIQDEYPSAVITPLADEALTTGHNQSPWSAEAWLTPDIFPILRHSQFEEQLTQTFADPVARVLGGLRPQFGDARIEIHVRPASGWRIFRDKAVIDRLGRTRFREYRALADLYARLVTSRFVSRRLLGGLLGWFAGRNESRGVEPTAVTAGRLHDRENDLQAAADKLGGHVFETRIRLIVGTSRAERRPPRERFATLAGALGAFTYSRLATFRIETPRRGIGPFRRRGFLLSNEELATLWHPPTAAVRVERMQTSEFTELEPPLALPSGNDPGSVVIGQVKFRTRDERFGLRRDDRRRHLYVVGKTGMGKTTLLLNQLVVDIAAGEGVGLIDPHGDVAETLLQHIPRHRTNDVVYFDAGDTAHPPSYNPLQCDGPHERAQVASGIVAAFHKIYGDSWGPRLEHILRNTVLAVLGMPGATFVSMLQMLGDPRYRETVLHRLDDSVVRLFWEREFHGWSDRYRSEAIAPIQNKVGQFLSSPVIRTIVGQPKGRLNLRDVMDNGRILIVNLSKGRIGEDASTLLGSLLVTGIQQAAMRRADQPEAERRDFSLTIDEFQNFATRSFAVILSEARKYRLSLTVAHQYLDQLDEATLSAVWGNCGSFVCFQVGSTDAERLAVQLSRTTGDVTARDLANVPKHTAYVRLLIDGVPSRPFTMQTLPPPAVPAIARAQTVRRASERRYSATLAMSSRVPCAATTDEIACIA